MVAGKLVAFDEKPIERTLRYVTYFGAFAIFAILVISLFVVPENRTAMFTWHPIFMTAAVCLLTHGVMVFRSPAVVTKLTGRVIQHYHEHAVVQTTAVVFFIIGVIIVVISLLRFGIAKPRGYHAWAGIITLTLVGVQAGSGVYKLFCSTDAGSKPKGARVHGSTGFALYVISAVTLCLGVTTASAIDQNFLGINKWFGCVIIALVALVVTSVTIRRFSLPYETSAETQMMSFLDRLMDDATHDDGHSVGDISSFHSHDSKRDK